MGRARLSKAPAFPALGAQQRKAVTEVFKYGLGNLHPCPPLGLGMVLVQALNNCVLH